MILSIQSIQDKIARLQSNLRRYDDRVQDMREQVKDCCESSLQSEAGMASIMQDYKLRESSQMSVVMREEDSIGSIDRDQHNHSNDRSSIMQTIEVN